MVEDIAKKKAAVYGVGRYLQDNLKYLDTALHICVFTDSDEKKWNRILYQNKRCIAPCELKTYGIEYVIIAVKDLAVYEEIGNKLSGMGIEYCHINDLLNECIEIWDKTEIIKYNALQQESGGSVLADGKIARYVECYMLKQACNLRCSYCFVGQSRELAQTVVPLRHRPELIARALSKKRLGGTSLISICCDGEPLIAEDMTELIRLLLEEGHYVYLISNGTVSRQMRQICRWPRQLLAHFFIRFSYHYFELKRLHLLEKFFGNVKNFHEAGGSFTLFLVGSESYLDEIEEIKSWSMRYLGALPHVDYERNETGHDGSVLVIKTGQEESSYKKFWDDFDSEFLRFRERTDKKTVGICNAGNWVLHLDLMTGDVSRCPVGSYIGNLYEDICAPFPFDTKGHPCPYDFCVCAPVFFAFGMKEDFRDAPTFYELWNRKTKSGENWIQDSARDFFSGKLYESYGK